MQSFNHLADYVSYTATFKNYGFGDEGLSWNKKIHGSTDSLLQVHARRR